ncbi:MAG TPA: P-II family nitrogen regulator [Bacteroidota bacterium]|jgi:nitrogen regulatory protein PII|nr:P-II family nitrogen regulator [Bacteroidota bacterium]
MKAVMIVYNHGISEEVDEALESLHIRGFTRFLNVHGQGSDKGEPHMGDHIWPSVNTVVITIVQDKMVEPLLEKIKEINAEAEEQGIHAFVWTIDKMV